MSNYIKELVKNLLVRYGTYQGRNPPPKPPKEDK